LDEAQSVAALVARLKPILNELAYYAINGEAAVMETREEWHTEFTDRLFGDMASELPKAPMLKQTDYAPKSSPGAMGATMVPPQDQVRKGRAKQTKPKIDERNTWNPAAVAAAQITSNGRPNPTAVSPALQAIMNGTHPSLSEKDYTN